MKISDFLDKNTEIKLFTRKTLFSFLLIIVFFVLVLKTFILDFFLVSSTSMAPTLYKKDVILVSRLAYFIGFADRIQLININISPEYRWYYKSPQKNDVIFFSNHFQSLSNYSHNYLIKRVRLIPGDTVYYSELSNGQTNYSITQPDNYNQDYSFAIIPSKNQTINLDTSNLKFYKHIIENEGGKVTSAFGDIYIDNQKAVKYQFKDNHYFVEGDNIDNSFDSRIYGLVPEQMILGKALIIFWSGASQKTNVLDRFLKWIE